MSGTPSTVLSLGIGSFASAGLLLTLGFGIAVGSTVPGEDVIIPARQTTVKFGNRQTAVPMPKRPTTVTIPRPV